MPAAPKQSEPTPRRVTRSSTKTTGVVNNTSKETAAAKRVQKRKNRDELAGRPNKRMQTNVQAEIQIGGHDDNRTPAEVTGPTEQATHQLVVATKAAMRKAPPRPSLSLDSEGEEGDGHVSDDNASRAESDEGVTDSLTAVDLINESPMPVKTVVSGQNDGMDTGTNNVTGPGLMGGKKTTRILNEVPVLNVNSGGNNVPAFPSRFASVQPAYPLNSTILSPILNAVLPPVESGVVPPPTLHPPPLVWPTTTDLVVGKDGRYRQSEQTREIQACLGAAVRRANGNLVFLNSFPDLRERIEWPGKALEKELGERRKGSAIMEAIDERAQKDRVYLDTLLHMIRGRRSVFRQGVIEMTRALVTSPESSYYSIPASVGLNRVQVAQNILLSDRYHFSTTTAGVVDTAAPYQHLEMFVALAYYFKGREAVGLLYGEHIPVGIYGPQMPDAMIALTATAIQVALEELVAGRASPFTENACREKYRIHLSTIEVVRASADGARKYARMMSNIYQGTIRYVALKFAVAELTSRNNEIKIHRHLASQSGTHPGSDHVLVPLDHFRVQGVNGEHDVLVFQVLGPSLGVMSEEEPTVVRKTIKSLSRQVALGTSFLHDCGVVHADLHNGNIAFEIPDLDGECEVAMNILGFPRCVPVYTVHQSRQSASFPKYLVVPGSLVKYAKQNQDDIRIKIIDLGEAFLSHEVLQKPRTPLQVRAPEVTFNHLSMSLKIELGMRMDVWSIGCLIYELATSYSLMGYVHGEVEVLDKLTTLLGPLPEEWMASLGTSYSGVRDASLEQRVRANSRIDDTTGLIKLLQWILVFDPLRRPDVSCLLDHPWFRQPRNGSV